MKNKNRNFLKRISAFILAILVTASTVLPAFGADGWSNARGNVEQAYEDFTFGSTAETAMQGRGYTSTGLSIELTYTQKKGLYGYTSGFDKFWSMNKKASTKDVTLPSGDVLSIDFSKLATEYLPCIADHTGDGLGSKIVRWRSQLFVSSNEVYLPSDGQKANFPKHVKMAGYTGADAKFATLLQMNTLTMHKPSESEAKDDTQGTEYAMVVYMTARAIELHKIGGNASTAEADWAAILTADPYVQQWYNPDNTGSSQIWNALNTTGKEYFIKCWEYASFMSYFDYDIVDKKVVVLLPMADGGEGGTSSKILDYSSFNEAAKKHFQEITVSSSGGVTGSNDGSKITLSGDGTALDKNVTRMRGGDPRRTCLYE